MDTTQRSSTRPSIGVIPFIVGVVAGGILGWLATTLVHTHAWRGRRRRVSPVQVQASQRGGLSGRQARPARAGAGGRG